MVKKCTTNNKKQSTRFLRVKILPSVLIPGTIYIVEDNNDDEFVNMFIADNNGNKKIIIDPSRISNLPEEELSLIDYKSDIMNSNSDYFYGYKYEDNSFKIIKVEKGNVVNQLRAINTTGSFEDNWDNRQILIYN